MLICRFCGSPIKAHSFVCSRCGRAITDMHHYEKEDKYGKYDISKDTSISGKSLKKGLHGNRILRGLSSLIWKTAIIFVVIVLPVYFGYSKIKNILVTAQPGIVKEAVLAAIEHDYDFKISHSIINYGEMLLDHYDDLYLGMRQIYRQEKEQVVEELKEEYGNDYTITLTIIREEKIFGILRKNAIEKAIYNYNKELETEGIDMDCSDYIMTAKIEEVKRAEVEAVVAGSKKSRKFHYVVDIAKVEGRRNWKVLYTYEVRSVR